MQNRLRLLFGALLAAPLVLSAAHHGHGDFKTTTVTHELDGVSFESTIVTPAEADGELPGILMIPNWMGPTDSSLEKARKIAGDEYVVMMADVYGVDVRPANSSEAGQAAGELRNDRALMRAREEGRRRF